MTLAKIEEKEEEMAKQTTKSLCLEAQLQSLTNTTNGELSTFEERVFRCILSRKEKTSTDGFIRVKNSRGRPVAHDSFQLKSLKCRARRLLPELCENSVDFRRKY